MPRLGPISRQDLVRCLRQLGFDGSFSGAKHQYMSRGTLTVRIPNPHQSDIGVGLLARNLQQADVDRAEWERL